MPNTRTWYEASTSGDQGLVIEETTGRSVAVAYDKADAVLIAAAPELLNALEYLIRVDDELEYESAVKQAREAITKAKGE